MARIVGTLVAIFGLALLVFAGHVPVFSRLFDPYWERVGGCVLAFIGVFFVWATLD